jgi:DNA-binding ferritin-like protein
MSEELARIRTLRQKLNKALTTTGSGGMQAFATMLLEAAPLAHLHHFAVEGVGSDAAHRALADLYDGLPDLVDDLVESYQGVYGRMPAPAGSPLEFAKALQAAVRAQRSTLPQDSELQNVVDEIATLVNRTVYRLENLK